MNRPLPRTEFASPSAYFRAPVMPRGARFLLWPTFEKDRKPYAFPTMAKLARHIHRARAGFGIELSAEPVSFADGRRTLIRVDAHDASGDRHRLIGYAWFGQGARRETLVAAMLDNEQTAEAGQ